MTVVTRWWWIRHAPVTADGGRVYGQTDIECDVSDRAPFQALAGKLPREAVWVVFNEVTPPDWYVAGNPGKK